MSLQILIIYFLENHTLDQHHTTGSLLYPLKISENQKCSDVSRGYRKRPVCVLTKTMVKHIWDHSVSTCAKFAEKLNI